MERHLKDSEYKFTKEELRDFAIEKLKERGVELEDICEIIYILQKDYVKDLNLDICMHHLMRVLSKEVVNAILTGIEIDILAEKGLLSEPMLSVIRSDEGLYGIDEILPLSIVNIYGSIGLTNFGYLDKKKIGIIEKIDKAKDDTVNTFLDDIVAALAAASASRLAHSNKEKYGA